MNYLFLTKTAFFNGLSENEIKTILNCLGAYQKVLKNLNLFITAVILSVIWDLFCREV